MWIDYLLHSLLIVEDCVWDLHVIGYKTFLELNPGGLLIVCASQVIVAGKAPHVDHELFSGLVIDVFIKVSFLYAKAFNLHAANRGVGDFRLA